MSFPTIYPHFIVLFLLYTLLACTSFVPHQGCIVVDNEVRGRYVGQCRDGYAHGFGRAIGRDTYEGDFVRGRIQGKGVYVWADGDKYIGELNDGQAHGQGVFIKKDGERISGMWQNNQIVRQQE